MTFSPGSFPRGSGQILVIVSMCQTAVGTTYKFEK